ncbi:MAG: hypothetical protein JXA19_04390 [Anaerolineales bacterium]|nr:hypothetical protein [Anaerolineales bacterium]
MKKKVAIFIILALILLVGTGSVLAQTYYFSVPREVVNVFWEDDGTLSLVYLIEFENSASASPIDYVDVGFPNNNYKISNVSADIDGADIYDIQDSPYVTYGVALGLGSNAIGAGESGTVHVYVTGITDVLYEDSLDTDYASAVFSPNYFGSEYVYGSTDLTVIYHLPNGVQPEEPRYHGVSSGFPEQPVAGFDSQDRITYTWRNPSADAYSNYLFGASFPKSYVPESAIASPSIWEKLNISEDTIFGCGAFLCFGFFFFGIPIISASQARKRKMQYLPPKLSISGHGVKRGLTAVEAAVLLEQPMDKILTMILFGVVKKDAAVVEKEDPMELNVKTPLSDDLRAYEKEFLEAFQIDSLAKRKTALQRMMVNLVKSVTLKMKGFSVKETKEYYVNITDKAWKMIESADTPEVKSDRFGEALEWTMLDDNYDRRTQDVFRTGPVYVPVWWGNYSPIYRNTLSQTGTGGINVSKPSAPNMRSTTAAGSLPGATFAATLTSSAQNFASGVVGNVRDFTSGVTNVTNPPPKPSTSSYSGRSSGGGGGRSCACACACAGCACACAGGGR